ncbi:hybrid-cluster NAD(P)-dependent oxidoreductase [Paracoccus sp. PS-1]|uniref:hybrid-cluster NAD(P)-dependent oxidoreductase n=1 Tax=unclassified Paracoccus (in: a-proteobacteria) TaxID=2688777 RepID=UPI00048E9A8C|nr:MULTISPECIES: hybrid-cluster NAD(P)-dependent oxidoreductase [unclassified Paracoccus (in: a-proteobacteria)]MDQ7263064.1 hybrid-cluster NAD(P)-dependent oxidoreductase [Paracoccus sp. PS1]RQP05820.1 MAG: hybrid-cluster NAD(P)-dependent oxidoreductase [Paracoccus sp. BP8]UFM67227.1 hybrid-cluster NAD(P)-dependent oxidoreductase [Paracoccus sp. MA]
MTVHSNLVVSDSNDIWRDTEELVCCSVVPEAPDVATISFVSPSGALFKFEPGQFLTLELPVPGETVWRTYTISSSPSRPLSISVTVKAQAGSIGTRWMLDHLRPGMRIKATGPLGVFTMPRNEKKKYLFISAGSGITPSLAMTTYLFDRATDIDVTLVNCARRPSEIIARKQFEHMAARVPSIKLYFIVEEDDPYQVWTGFRGRLNQIMLGLIAGDYMEREVYCCGPEPFMDAVREMLIALGYDMEHYHQESFAKPIETVEDIEEHDDVVPDDHAAAKITFAASSVDALCTETDTVLAVAKRSGLNIPSGCTFGVCGTCKIRKLSGQVHMVHSGGISDDDIEEGYILACCSKPIGHVEVEV